MSAELKLPMWLFPDTDVSQDDLLDMQAAGNF